MSSDLDRQIEQLRRCEPLKEAEVKALCMKAMEIFVEESNVQRVDTPVTVSCNTTNWSLCLRRRFTICGGASSGMRRSSDDCK